MIIRGKTKTKTFISVVPMLGLGPPQGIDYCGGDGGGAHQDKFFIAPSAEKLH